MYKFDEETKEDLIGLTGYIFEMEYEDMFQQLIDEPSYLEEGIITQKEYDELENLPQSDDRVEEIVIKSCLDSNNLHIYALAYRVWHNLIKEEEEEEEE